MENFEDMNIEQLKRLTLIELKRNVDLVKPILKKIVWEQIIDKNGISCSSVRWSGGDFCIEAPNWSILWVICDDVIDFICDTRVGDAIEFADGQAHIDPYNFELRDEFVSDVVFTIMSEIRKEASLFDVDTEFADSWSKNSEIKPTTLIRQLEEDQEFFQSIK